MQYNHQFHNQSPRCESGAGFTMIEMLVVVAIIAILPTIIISNFPKIKLQFALSRSAYAFAQDIRRAQDMSLSAMQYQDGEGNIQAISGYGVYLDMNNLGNKKYIIYADAYPGNHQYDNALDYIVETLDMSVSEPGVIIKEIKHVFSNTVSINFSPPNPSINITSFNEQEHSIDVVFTLEDDLSREKIVSINTAGLIEVK